MGMVNSLIPMEEYIQVDLKTVNIMAMGNSLLQLTVMDMKENGRMVKNMVKEIIMTKMDRDMKENGKMTQSMVMGY